MCRHTIYSRTNDFGKPHHIRQSIACNHLGQGFDGVKTDDLASHTRGGDIDPTTRNVFFKLPLVPISRDTPRSSEFSRDTPRSAEFWL
jgi:hypothetical protein